MIPVTAIPKTERALPQEENLPSYEPPTRLEKETAKERIFGPNPYTKTVAQEEAFMYMCGAIISRYLRDQGDCSTCEELLCSEAPIRSFVEMRKFDPTCRLKYPSHESIKYFRILDNILYKHLPSIIYQLNVMNTLHSYIKRSLPSKLPCCDDHVQVCEEQIIKYWIGSSIRIFCKDFLQNRENKKRVSRKRKKMLQCGIPNKRSL